MTIRKSNPWEVAHKISASVPLPGAGYSLYATCRGPPRASKSPLLILFTGAGAPIADYVKIQDHLSAFVRTFFYDRMGYDQSTMDQSVRCITADESAQELHILLKTIEVEPPFILVGHSYGGIIAREFLDLELQQHKHLSTQETITGMVMFDTSPELTFTLFPRIPSEDLMVVAKDVDWACITRLKEESHMTDEEWAYAIEATKRSELAVSRENTHGSARSLARKRQLEGRSLGDGALVVVRCNSTRDYQQMYDEGVKLGSGTSEQRDRARKFIEDWSLFNHELSRAQLDLVGEAGKKLYTYLSEWGHDSPIRRPALVGSAVHWILEQG